MWIAKGRESIYKVPKISRPFEGKLFSFYSRYMYIYRISGTLLSKPKSIK